MQFIVGTLCASSALCLAALAQRTEGNASCLSDETSLLQVSILTPTRRPVDVPKVAPKPNLKQVVKKVLEEVAPKPNLKQVVKQVLEKWGNDAVQKDWFRAKDSYMFRGVLSKAGSEERKASDKQIPKMLELVQLRSEFMCQVLLGQSDKNCLFDEDDKPKKVHVPATIPALGGMAEPKKFLQRQQQCVAMALGSVTYLSDLDFTVLCNGRVVEDDTDRKQAMDEVAVAESLTKVVQEILGAHPGVIFDTNFYTNTFAYGPGLGRKCTANPLKGVAMAMYAVARGLAAIECYAAHNDCGDVGDFTGLDTGYKQGFHASPVTRMFKALVSKLRGMKESALGDSDTRPQQLEKIYTRIAMETATQDAYVSHTVDGKELEIGRTSFYFDVLKQAFKHKYKRFCTMTALALIFANEAYWVEGAINDVVFHKKVDSRQGFESAMMNIGYTMEHLVHEMEKGDVVIEKSPSDIDVMECNYGDGLIKFGKYTKRVVSTLTQMEVLDRPVYKTGVVPEVFKLATEMLAAKAAGKKQETSGNARGLPEEYVKSFKAVIKSRDQRCAFIQKLAKAMTLVVLDLLDHWK